MTEPISPTWLAIGLATGAVSATGVAATPNEWGIIWQLLACAGGALTSQAMRPYKNVSWREGVISFAVAFCFAFFVTPGIFGPPKNTREDGLAYYGMAAGAFTLLPLLIRKLRQMVEGVEKPSGDSQ